MSEGYRTEQTEYNLEALKYDLPLLKKRVRELERRIENGGGFDAQREWVYAREDVRKAERQIKHLQDKLDKVKNWGMYE